MTKHGVSLIICCHNSAHLLPTTLKHIAAQKVSKGISWEIIIVDNASTDNTYKLASLELSSYGSDIPFRIVVQPKLGLSHARQKGFQCAQYEFILFCDDDNWLDENYIEYAYTILSENSKIGVLGGHGEPTFETSPPEWFGKLRLFAVGPQAPQIGKVKENIVYGAGFLIRKSAYQKLMEVKIKSLLSDRTASVLSSGGDFELCYLISMAGYEVWYHNKLKFKHFFPQSRLSWEYYRKFISESYQCFEVLEPYKFLVRYNSSSRISFNLYLFKAFFYFTKKILPALAFKYLYSSGSLKGKINKINYEIYRSRLVSYVSNYRAYTSNYEKGRVYKDLLKKN